MTGPEDVLPPSEHLHAVAPGWPVEASHRPQLVQLAGAGRLLDAARRQASEIAYPRADWPATRQPVGLLYREDGVNAIRSWLAGLIDRLGAATGASELRAQLEALDDTFYRAVETETPLLRLYEYAAEAIDEIVIIVNARKAFVFWDTEMGEDSREALPDISGLWPIGESLEPAPAAPLTHGAVVAIDPAAEQQARSYERRVPDEGAPSGRQHQQREHLDDLIAAEAGLNPTPSAADVIPSRAGILWRPRRLEIVDVDRLRRWLRHRTVDPAARVALAGVSSFIESARLEHADVLLDALVTDSPEAL